MDFQKIRESPSYESFVAGFWMAAGGAFFYWLWTRFTDEDEDVEDVEYIEEI